MNNVFSIKDEVIDMVKVFEKSLTNKFLEIDDLEFYFSTKVLAAFKEENLNVSDFSSTTGYGYNDFGRDKIERIFARVLGGEASLVRRELVSGTHAISTALFGLLRPGDLMLSISGTPYDTLHEVIGIKDNESSLKSFNVKYDEIDLVNNDFNYDLIEEYLTNNLVKLIHIQRSKGYSLRDTLSIDKLDKVIKLIKKVSKDTIIMVDNCYCEFVEKLSPLEVGADIIVGSLIKNLGGGISPVGGYIAGKSKLVYKASERLYPPGQGKEVGPSLSINKSFLLGLYNAPKVVASSLKVSLLASSILSDLGYQVTPSVNDKRCDIVTSVIFNDRDKLINFTKGIQSASAIDANSDLLPVNMPGYDDKIIMASGSFVDGSSIEISCDGPIRKPYVAYLQGGCTYAYGKLALMSAISKII